MSPDLLRLLGENQISRTRPVCEIIATGCLLLAGMMVMISSVPYLLTGLFVGAHVLIIPGIVLAAGGLCFPLSWGLFRVQLWAWGGTLLLTLPIIALALWMENYAASRWWESLLSLLLCVQLLLWWGSVRRWFFRSHRLRARGYEGVNLPVASKQAMPEL